MSGFEWNNAIQEMGKANDLDSQTIICCCIGPQNGEPLCPCRMKNVRIRGGRYIETIDHGAVKKDKRLQAEVEE